MTGTARKEDDFVSVAAFCEEGRHRLDAVQRVQLGQFAAKFTREAGKVKRIEERVWRVYDHDLHTERTYTSETALWPRSALDKAMVYCIKRYRWRNNLRWVA